MYKKIIITFLLIFSAFLGFERVSAQEIVQFCEYSEECFTTEDLDNIIKNSNVDTSVYDSYTVLASYNSDNKPVFDIYLFRSDILNDEKHPTITWGAWNYYIFSGRDFYRALLEEPINFENVNFTYVGTREGSDPYTTIGQYTKSGTRYAFNYYSNATIKSNSGDTVYSANAIEEEYLNITEDIEKVVVEFNISNGLSNLDFNVDISAKSSNDYIGYFGEPYISKSFIDSTLNLNTDISIFNFMTKDTIISELLDLVDDYFKDSIKNEKDAIYDKWLDFINNPSLENWNKYYKRFYGDHLSSNIVENCFKLYEKLINNNYTYENNYFGSYNITFLPDCNYEELNLEINTSNYVGLLDLNINSNLNYTIKYIYKESNKSYLKTIDMTDYSALILIPKVYNTDNYSSISIMSDIYISGNYDIELWKDIESREVLFRYNNYNQKVFSHYFHRDYKNEVLYFIKKENDENNKYIIFDVRYYNYAIKNNLKDEINIVNPNTGEIVVIPDITDLYYYGSSDKKFVFSFNTFTKPIKFIFQSITNFYENYCPDVVQHYFFFTFVIIISLILVKLFL